MIKTKITEQEQNEVIEMIKTYRSLHDQVAETLMNTKSVQDAMNKIQKTLDDLDAQKNELLANIESNRDKERKWVGDLIAKYGNGKLNLETMEWTVPEEGETITTAPQESTPETKTE
jgi:hypothetical protein